MSVPAPLRRRFFACRAQRNRGRVGRLYDERCMPPRQTRPVLRSLLSNNTLEECRLIVIEGPDKGLEVPLQPGSTSIGADERCDLVLTDETVSSLHAEIFPAERGLQLRDRDSTNGTFYLESQIHDAVLQPGSSFRVGHTVLAVLHPVERRGAEYQEDHYGDLLGSSRSTRTLFSRLAQLEGCEVSVLLDGETGTGKSTIAEELHRRSPRADGPFVVLDCGAISPSLLSSELFGHKRGAFTGATHDRAGVLESAHGGTLLLEEIGEMPLDMQPALLRCTESGSYTRVGETKARRADVRILSATNRDLETLVEEKSFRADLFYRLAVVRLRVPPLRQRIEDIPALARAFLLEHDLSEARVDELLSAQALALLQSYGWPGNLRQLKNALSRLAVTGAIFDDELQAEDEQKNPTYRGAKTALLRRFEGSYFRDLLRAHDGNLSAVARASGLVRHHLRDLLKRNDLSAEDFRPKKKRG